MRTSGYTAACAAQIQDVEVGRYQAWVPPQCGQPTEVDTWASNTNPQPQL